MDVITLALAKKYTDKQIENSEHQGPGTITWKDVKDKPEEFPPASHTHKIEQVEDLQTTLDEKAPSSHVIQKINEAETHGMRVNVDGKFEFFNGTDWVEVSGGGSGGEEERWQLIDNKTMAVLGDFWYSTYVNFQPYKKLKFIYKSVSGHYQSPAVTATQLQLQFGGTSPTFATLGHRFMRMVGTVVNATNNTLRDLIPLLSANMAASTSYPHHELNGYLIIEKIDYKDNNNGGFLPYSMEVETKFNVRNPNGAAQNIMFEKQELVFPLNVNQNFPTGITMSNNRNGGFTKGTIEVWGVLND